MTSTGEGLLSPEDVAKRLRLDEEGPDAGARRVLRLTRERGWPCVRFTNKLIRFTHDDVEEIVRRHHGTTSRPATTVGLAGQTARSRRRAS